MTPRLLDLALRFWPEELRDRDGAVLVDTATQLIEDGHSRPLTESVAIARSGLALRLREKVARGATIPWAGAAGLLLAPLLVVALIIMAGQLVWADPTQADGFRTIAVFQPGFSSLLPLGLLLLALVAAAAKRPTLAGWAALTSLLAVIARIVRAESFGQAAVAQRDLDFGLGHWGGTVDADAVVLPVLALAVLCAFILGRTGGRVRLVPAGAVLLAAGLALGAGWELSRAETSLEMTASQAPSLFLICLAPILFFLATLLLRIGGAVRLAASLSLVVAGPALAWIVSGLPVFYDWPDGLIMVTQLGLNAVWFGVMVVGIVSSAEPDPAPKGLA